jgi:hypothetical protein
MELHAWVHRTAGHVGAVFFFMAPFFCTVAPFFFPGAIFFLPVTLFFLHRFTGLYNHSCCQQTEEKNNSYTKQWRYLT